MHTKPLVFSYMIALLIFVFFCYFTDVTIDEPFYSIEVLTYIYIYIFIYIYSVLNVDCEKKKKRRISM